MYAYLKLSLLFWWAYFSSSSSSCACCFCCSGVACCCFARYARCPNIVDFPASTVPMVITDVYSASSFSFVVSSLIRAWYAVTICRRCRYEADEDNLDCSGRLFSADTCAGGGVFFVFGFVCFTCLARYYFSSFSFFFAMKSMLSRSSSS